jgi:LuxR family transcriptional regulator, maltose regulon positive regulatory protein
MTYDVEGAADQPAPAGGDPLLESKFAVPAPPRFVVARPRLWDRLAASLREPLAVVTGPAGSGKTELVASWVRAGSVDEPVVWISLEDGDGSPQVFWSYVVEGLRRAGLTLRPAATRPVPDGDVDRSFLVRLAAELAGQPRPVVLVLDDVSVLTDQRWADDLDFVLRHAGRRLRLVLVGRWYPPLPLYRYRLVGRLGEIRGEDLVFTPAETGELLVAHGVALGQAALTSVVRHTEGWAAGVRLVALALDGRAGADSLVGTIHGDQADIAGYFVGEVLRNQPDEVQDLLLRTSILDTVTPELADLLTGRGDARHTLAHLQQENAFVQPVEDEPGSYRYHALFRELLQARLADRDPDEVPQLHRRAAAGFVAQGRTGEAIEHAARAGDWTFAATLAVDDLAVGNLVLAGADGRLGALFHDLPEDTDSPEAAMVAAALALAAVEPDRCAKHLARAEELVADTTGGTGTALALTGTLLDTLLAAKYHDSPRVLQSAQATQALLDQVPPERLHAHPELSVLLLSAQGSAQSWLGSLDAAASALTEAARTTCGAGAERIRLYCLQHLAMIEAYRGRLRRAGQLANQALTVAEDGGASDRVSPATAHVVLAWTATEHYDLDTAWRQVRTAEPMCERNPGGLAALGLAVVKSRLLRARGEFRGALEVLSRATAVPESTPVWLARELALCRARLFVASGRCDEALALVADLGEPPTPDATVVRAAARLAAGDRDEARRIVTALTEAHGLDSPVPVEARLVLAALAADRGETGRARQALKRALGLAAPEAQRRCFHEVGARLRQLLRDDEDLAAQFAALGGPVRQPGHRPGGSRDDAEPVIVDPLSKREMEVLRYVAAMLPTEEIAARMYVSVNTVKTHVRSILRKLSASRRNEAVRRARSLGLI